MSKTHSLTLNNGAMYHLSGILGSPGLLSDPADLYRAGQIIEEKLRELPKPDEIPKGTDMQEAEAMIRKWQRQGAHVIELSERHRDTAKKAVKAACEKGNIPPGPASMCLLFELGLVEGA